MICNICKKTNHKTTDCFHNFHIKNRIKNRKNSFQNKTPQFDKYIEPAKTDTGSNPTPGKVSPGRNPKTGKINLGSNPKSEKSNVSLDSKSRLKRRLKPLKRGS